jgi:DNA-binding beta-propeller fold protein YncE
MAGVVPNVAGNFSQETLVVLNNTIHPGNFLATDPIGPGPIAVDNSSGTIFLGDTWGYVTFVNASSGAISGNLRLPFGPTFLAYDATNGMLYAGSLTSNRIAIINASSSTVVKYLATGDEPSAIAVDPTTGNVYVANQGNTGAGNVTAINGSTQNITSRFQMGGQPGSVGIDPVTHAVYVTNQSGTTVDILKTGPLALQATVRVGGDPGSIAFDPRSGNAYIANSLTNNVSVINGTTYSVQATIKVAGTAYASGPLIYDPANGCIYSADQYGRQIAVIQTSNNSIVAEPNISGSSQAVAYDGWDQDVFFVGGGSAVSVVASSNNSLVAVIRLAGGPEALAVAGNADDVFVPGTGSDTLYRINGSSLGLAGRTYTAAQPVGVVVDNASGRFFVTESDLGIVSVINTTTDHIVSNISVCSDPRSEALDARSGILWVLCPGDSIVVAVNASSEREVASFGTGNSPSGMVVDPANDNLFVSNFYSGNFTIINGSTLTNQGSVGVGQYPQSPVVDPSTGDVFSLSSWYHNISEVSPTTDQVIRTIQVSGANVYPYWMLFDPNQDTLDVATLSPNAVYVYNASSGTLVTTVQLGGVSGPTALNGIGLDASTGYLYAAYLTLTNASVAVINTSTNRIVQWVPAGGQPSGFLADPESHVVFVVNGQSDSFEVLNETTHRPLGNVTFGSSPGWASVDPATNTVYVASVYQGTISILRPAPTFPVEFNETGLPAGTPWSVTVDGAQNTSTNVSLGFRELNGTHGFSVGAPAGYFVSPAEGNFTVNGSAALIAIAFTKEYLVRFNESGLTSGVRWSVILNGTTVTSNATAIDIYARNATMNYSIVPMSGWEASIYRGSVTVSGASVVVNVTWTNVTYEANFTESGLPNGTSWGVTVGNTTANSTAATVRFELSNGSYRYHVENVPGWRAAEYAGTLIVENGTSNVSLNWTRAVYELTFTESGLPSGTAWSITFNGSTEQTRNRSLVESVPNGTFEYNISGVPGYRTATFQGTVTVNGSDVVRTVNWTLNRFDVYFNETGLPNGTLWSVWYNGSWSSTIGSSLRFAMPNGTSNFSIRNLPGWRASEYTGYVSVDNGTANRSVAWAGERYQVAFVPVGLPQGQSWIVILGGFWNRSVGPMTFLVANGTYSLTIASVDGLQAHPGRGDLVVSGQPLAENITFLPPPMFTVTFSQRGLAIGTAWSISMTGNPWNVSEGDRNVTSTSLNATFQLRNGTFGYAISTEAQALASPSQGTVTVEGEPRQIAIDFRPISLFEVSFDSRGLPAGTPWGVTVGTTALNGTGSELSIRVSNGTYGYRVAGIGGYLLPTFAGTIVVNGSPRVLELNWTQTTYVVSFVWDLPGGAYAGALVGSSAGAEWNVSLGGTPVSAVAGSSLNMDLPNGSYPFTVQPPAGYEIVKNGSGQVNVDGKGSVILVVFELSPTSNPSGAGARGGFQPILAAILLGTVAILLAVLLWRRARGGTSPSSEEEQPFEPNGDETPVDGFSGSEGEATGTESET